MLLIRSTIFLALITLDFWDLVQSVPYLTYELSFSLELPVKERKTLERQQKERQEQLSPIYQQVIQRFLHLSGL